MSANNLTERNIYLEDIPMTEARAALDEALRALGKLAPLPGERVGLRQALGRVLAEPLWARRSVPHYHACAVDGYAVRAADTAHASETRPIGLALGTQALAVNTGEPLPEGMDAVIMIENVQHERDSIRIMEAVAPYQHVRVLGEDVVASELILPAGQRLRPVDLGVAAASGYHEVTVRRRPLVVLIPTGNELVSADQEPQYGQIIEFNSLVLSAQIEDFGGQALVLPITPDDPAALQNAIETALSHMPNLILVLSGSSAGSKDFTARLVRQIGRLLVHGVAVRPGHPVIMGLVQDVPLIGVPGYPVSAALTGDLFVNPLLAAWLGVLPVLDGRPRLRAQLTRKLTSPIGDDDFVRVTLARVGERVLATPLSRGAGVITSLVRADGLAHIPRFVEGAEAGQEVDIILYHNDPAVLARTIAHLGSHDPMLDLLAQFLTERFPGWRLSSGNVGSLGGLVALRRREAHLAGIHLLDEATGNYNVPYLERQLKGLPVRLVTFAHREQGLMVTAGNPMKVTGLDDLRRLRFVNRQRGAGTRLLLDYELKQRGISPDEVQGYANEQYTHLAVAAAVAAGVADCGLGVRSAAQALGLDFVSVGWERYDLAIPQEHWEHEGVQHLLAVIRDDAFRRALSQQHGYDGRETGQIVYE
ncbi:MAG: molybdopterin biosynthesis protein [Anaerolineae bacterium]|nr:molybdopterin biosynthesis protein [Anaerolineae bacterium]MDW8172840.1 molybdopterin biosynthesis protein [Anaerolineae bacterium]